MTLMHVLGLCALAVTTGVGDLIRLPVTIFLVVAMFGSRQSDNCNQ